MKEERALACAIILRAVRDYKEHKLSQSALYDFCKNSVLFEDLGIDGIVIYEKVIERRIYESKKLRKKTS